MEGAAIGTPLYMSVEQLRGVKDIDVRADVYAFGVILYQAVTGQPPFDADSFPVLIAKIMTEQALSPKVVRPDVPTSLSRLIEWAMARDRQERVPTIEALIAELEPYATEVGFRKQMTVGSSDIPSISTPSSRPRSDRAAAVAKTEPQPIAIEERSSARSDRSSAIGATSIPKSQRPWGLYALGLLCVLALTFWLWPTDEPAAQPDPHIVRPAIEPVASKAPAQPAIVTPPAAPLITPAKAPQPSAAPTATLPTSSAPPTSSRRTSPRASVAKEAPSIAKVSAPVPLVAVKEKPAPPEVKAQPAPAPTPKAASRLRAGEPSADDF